MKAYHKNTEVKFVSEGLSMVKSLIEDGKLTEDMELRIFRITQGELGVLGVAYSAKIKDIIIIE